MRLSCLKIKPPPIVWSPAATIGLGAALGSYGGTKLAAWQEVDLFLYSLGITLSVVGLLFTSRTTKVTTATIAVFLLFLGRSAGEEVATPTPWTMLLEGELVELSCKITSDPLIMDRTKGDMLQFDHRTKVTRFYATATPPTPNRHSPHQVEVSVRVDGVCWLHKGDEIKCIGWFRESVATKTKYAVYVPNKNVVKKITPEKSTTIGRFRDAARERVLLGIIDRNRTLGSALFFGVRGEGWNETSLQFRSAGMAHILAISGLHVGLLVYFFMQALKRFRVGRIPTLLAVIVFVVSILLLIEARAPAIRAVVMFGVVFGMRAGGMRPTTTGLLGVAATAILLFHPRDAGSLGFQLSFIVVASICVLLPHIKWRLIGPTSVYRKGLASAQYWIISMWVTGLCAWLASSPITAHTFGTISPSGLVTNVPAIGLLALSLVFGVARLCFGWIDVLVDQAAQQQLDWVLSGFWFVAREASRLPFAHIQGISLSWIWSATLFMWLVWWSVAIRKRWRIWAVAPCLVAGITASIPLSTGKVVITTIDVGHGTSHVIQHRQYTMMIDGGSKSNLDVGSNTILSTIRKLGITSIDVVVITHSDLDHIAGLVDVFKSMRVNRVLVAKHAIQHQTPPLAFVLHEAIRQNIPILEVSTGWEAETGDVRIRVLSPSNNEPYRSPNAASIVMEIQAHGRTVLLTGDIDEQKITELLPLVERPVDVLELPHHGQWSQESQSLVNALRPSVLIQSTNISRHAKDTWSIPTESSRFVTAVDGTLTTTIFPSGDIKITGLKHPVSMPPCCISN
jgi:ComEC/Rec2-related protein